MGLVVEMGFRVKKFVVISIKTCYKSVRNYPFPFVLLCFFILLYRSSPFLFSLLVSASPVLICTAVLLGTLLSFGQPSIPEIRKEENISCNVACFRSGILEDTTFVAKDNNGCVFLERFDGNKVVGLEEDRKSSKFDVPIITNYDREIQFEMGVVKKTEVEDTKLYSSGFLEKRETYEMDFDMAKDGENVVENQLLVPLTLRNMILEVEDRNISTQPMRKEDNLISSLNENDSHDENHYNSSGSELDTTKSSSSNASITDIIPLLDELHPLLDSETLLPGHRSNEESDSSSQLSNKSDSDEAETQGEEVGVEDDDDDEGMLEEKEDESKSAIKWTDDDQKNLMDLGTLELERNQYLENLIARRKAKENLRMLTGKNLIDLDDVDLPLNVPSISTARHNPFDLPYDSYNNTGFPSIPGSAPSILLPTRNPFDVPFDPNEERPDLNSVNFEQEFFPPQHKDIFRRHDSFSVGASNFFAIPKPEQQNIILKPYFIPVKISTEEGSYSPLERQLSDANESKQSSFSDTDSIGSIEDQDEKKTDESQTFLEITTVSYLDPTTISIEHGNGMWEDIGAKDFIQENRDVHHEVIEITLGSSESHIESKSGSSEIGAKNTSIEINASEIHSKSVLVETKSSSNTNMCSLSKEVIETPFEVKTYEVRVCGPRVHESGIETTTSASPVSLKEESDFRFVSEELDDNQHREPVYDSSPSAEGKDSNVRSEIEHDFTFGLKDVHDGSSKLHLVDQNEHELREVPVVIVREVTKIESPKHVTSNDAHNLSVASERLVEHVSVHNDTSISKTPLIEKGLVNNIKEDKDQLTSHDKDNIDGTQKIGDENLGFSPSCDQVSSWSLAFAKPEDQPSSSISHVSTEIGSSSDAKCVEIHESLNNKDNAELRQSKICSSSSSSSNFPEELILKNDVVYHTDQPSSSKSIRGSEIADQDLEELVTMTNSEASSHDHLTTTNATTLVLQEQKNHAAAEEQVVLLSSISTLPFGSEQVDECSRNEKEFVRTKHDFVQLSSFKSHTESKALQNDEEPSIVSTDSTAEVNSENIAPNVHQDISTAQSSVDSDSSSSSSDHDFRPPYSGRYPKDGTVDQAVFKRREEVTKHLDYLAEAYGSRFLEKMIREEVNDIADIDEGLLLEFDENGNFTVKEIGEPILEEEEVMQEETQAEGFEFGSVSNPTEAKSDVPILEARSLDDSDLVNEKSVDSNACSTKTKNKKPKSEKSKLGSTSSSSSSSSSSSGSGDSD